MKVTQKDMAYANGEDSNTSNNDKSAPVSNRKASPLGNSRRHPLPPTVSPIRSNQGSTNTVKKLKKARSTDAIWETNKSNDSVSETFKYKEKGKRSPDDPLPLSNLGNTCYLNSMIQSIFIFGCFFTYLIQKYDYVKTTFSSLSDGFKMTKTLVSIYKEYCKQKALPEATDAMDKQIRSLKASVGEKCSQFNSLQQQDTVEFLTLVLGTIDEEFERIREIPQEQNPIKRYFEIEFESHLRCLKCGQDHKLPKQTTQAMYLCIPPVKADTSLMDGTTLQQIIMDHFKDEKIEHKCEASGCGGREKVRTVQMSKLPRILFLQLGRYAEDGNKRLETVYAPQEVLIPGSQSGSTQFSNFYRLVAVICHQGSNLNSGHYVSYVYNDVNQTWYSCDDDSITKVCVEKVQACSKQTAYCFFYVNDAFYKT